MSVIGLCLRINDSGWFACMILTALCWTYFIDLYLLFNIGFKIIFITLHIYLTKLFIVEQYFLMGLEMFTMWFCIIMILCNGIMIPNVSLKFEYDQLWYYFNHGVERNLYSAPQSTFLYSLCHYVFCLYSTSGTPFA